MALSAHGIAKRAEASTTPQRPRSGGPVVTRLALLLRRLVEGGAIAAAVGAVGFAAEPPQPKTTVSELSCHGITYVLSTGTSDGECLMVGAERDAKAMCLDRDSNASYATCADGCLASNGRGSCSLSGEEPMGGSFLLACESGDRYVLRTRTGRGICRADRPEDAGAGADRAARCADGKSHSIEASCAKGCGRARGSGMCGRYKKDGVP
jgi:hypothetical protein